jgi:hypothetical protein
MNLSLMAGGKAMVKLVLNFTVSASLARALLVCYVVTIGFAPSAKADDYQYTVTFDPSNSTGLSTTFAFETTSLLGSATVSIDPSDIQLIAAPHAGSVIQSLEANNQGFAVDWLLIRNPSLWSSEHCSNANCVSDDAAGTFLNPITAPGTYQFNFVDMTDQVIGGGTAFEYHTPADSSLYNSNVSIVVTPEPKSGPMVGACFLMCAAVVLRRKTPGILNS